MTESVGPVSMSRGGYAGYEIIRGVNIKVRYAYFFLRFFFCDRIWTATLR